MDGDRFELQVPPGRFATFWSPRSEYTRPPVIMQSHRSLSLGLESRDAMIVAQKADKVVCATKRAGHDVSWPYNMLRERQRIGRRCARSCLCRSFSSDLLKGAAWFGCDQHTFATLSASKSSAPTGNDEARFVAKRDSSTDLPGSTSRRPGSPIWWPRALQERHGEARAATSLRMTSARFAQT